MQLLRSIDEIDKGQRSVVTNGTFDGVHAGHKEIISKLREYASKNEVADFIVTFEPHPRTVVSKYNIKLLTTFEEKSEFLKSLGVQNLLVLDFTKEFSQQSYEDFIKKYVCEKLNSEHLIIGHDHKFGKDRDGNENKLRSLGDDLGFTVEIVEPVSRNEIVVSSSQIRKLLHDGEVQKAAELLGRKYCFRGKVVRGVSRGTILGFPTANIEIANKQKPIPQNGVYIVECIVGTRTI